MRAFASAQSLASSVPWVLRLSRMRMISPSGQRAARVSRHAPKLCVSRLSATWVNAMPCTRFKTTKDPDVGAPPVIRRQMRTRACETGTARWIALGAYRSHLVDTDHMLVVWGLLVECDDSPLFSVHSGTSPIRPPHCAGIVAPRPRGSIQWTPCRRQCRQAAGRRCAAGRAGPCPPSNYIQCLRGSP